MKIIIIQAGGMHDGTTNLCKNDYLRESLSLQYAFNVNGWEADVWGFRFPNFNIIPNFEEYDYILVLENYEVKWLPDFSKISKPKKIQWIIDLHYQNIEVYKNISKDMDIILHSTKLLMNEYTKLFPNKTHIWFPNGFDDRYFEPSGDSKKQTTNDIIFIGNLLNRKDLIEYMIRNYNMKYYMKTGDEMIKLIQSTKINFNKSISVDVNYRNFETIGTNTCLLTNYLPELEELGFKNGVNCLMYKSIEDIDKKIKYALLNDNWKTIAKNGYEFSKNHTYVKRVSELILKLN